jgi:hypothetical protein
MNKVQSSSALNKTVNLTSPTTPRKMGKEKRNLTPRKKSQLLDTNDGNEIFESISIQPRASQKKISAFTPGVNEASNAMAHQRIGSYDINNHFKMF